MLLLTETETTGGKGGRGGGVMIYICEDISIKRLVKHVLPYDVEGLCVEFNFRRCK